MSSHNIFGVWILITIIITAVAVVADTTSIKPKLRVDTFPLDVDELDGTSYENFLKQLRGDLTNNKDPPVLPAATEPPQFFDLALSAYVTKKTTVRFQKDNLYVIGYQAQTPEKKWFELGRTSDTKHLIDGSTFLGYRGDYGDLQNAADKSVTQISLTQFAFSNAVSTLSNSKSPKDSTTKENQERARALILIVQMVSEACRFIDISNYLAENFFSTPTYLEEWMFNDLEKNWSKFSGYVLFPETFQPVTINNEVIDSVAKLREILGVLLKTNKSVKQLGEVDGDDVDDEPPNITDVQDAEPKALEA